MHRVSPDSHKRYSSCTCSVASLTASAYNDVTGGHRPTGKLRSCACVMLANFSDETLTVLKATVLGIAGGISESLVDKISVTSEAKLNEPTKPPWKRKNEILYDKYLLGKLHHLSSAEREHIEPVLRKYATRFP